MSQGHGVKIADARRLLVERVVLSPYLNRSARLRDLLVYLTDRVLEDDAGEIHEQEVGHKVFGRPLDYDTTADNIVRVHASMLRKRLEQYFSIEGAGETMVLEIPKGNYAPVFHERAKLTSEPAHVEPLPVPEKPRRDLRLATALAAASLFACSTAFLLLRGPAKASISAAPPTVRLFWSQILRPDHATDLVMDDAAVGLYQELTGHALSLTEYYDRSYLRGVPAIAAAAGLDAQAAASIVLRRQSNFSDVGFLWKLLQTGGERGINLRFARDYSFRDLKADNAILLGTDRSNPWLQAFESKLGIRWQFDKPNAVYYPVDVQSNRSYVTGQPGEAHEGFFSIALLPNLGGTGNVLLLSGTGGSAVNAAADFLVDQHAMALLRGKLPVTKDGAFPPFEALVKAKGRSGLPRDAEIVVCRPAGK
jgi:hypothetical protein